MSDVVLGSIYRDLQGVKYRVILLATDTETEQECVVYKHLYGATDVFISPTDVFKVQFVSVSSVGIDHDYTNRSGLCLIEGVVLGGKYEHFKGNKYKALYISKHNVTGDLCVLYKALYGENIVWARSLRMFLDTVNREGQSLARFTLLKE